MADKNTSSELLFYATEDGNSKIEVRLENETVWLSQKQMTEFFQTKIHLVLYAFFFYFFKIISFCIKSFRNFAKH